MHGTTSSFIPNPHENGGLGHPQTEIQSRLNQAIPFWPYEIKWIDDSKKNPTRILKMHGNIVNKISISYWDSSFHLFHHIGYVFFHTKSICAIFSIDISQHFGGYE